MKLIAAALAVLLSAQEGKVELRWKWQKGRELVYKTAQKTLMELGGQPMEQQIGYTYSMTVQDVTDKGEATILMKYLGVVAKGTGPAGDYDYDSEKDKEPPAEGPAAMQARMLGLSFTMKITTQGRVTDVQGYDKLLDALTKGQEENPAVKAQLKQMFNNETFKGMMQQMAPPLPEAQVGKGDAWSSDFSIKMPMIGAMSFTMSSKLADLKENNAQVDQDIKVELKGGDKDNPLAGLVELKDAKGKASGIFSLEKGCFLSQKTTMEMVMAVQGQQMPLKTVSELKLVSRK